MLPGRKDRGDETSPQQELVDTWNLASRVTTATVAGQSHLVGKTVEDVGLWATYEVNLLLLREGGDVQLAPWRQTRFAAILGGTLTMVASGPLIILNDILRQGGQASFGLFAVTPVGLTLLIAGIL